MRVENVERDRYRDEIAKRRLANSTYQPDRQCQAEAEALMIVQRVRDAAFRLDDRTFTDAYFLSNTRVIDDVIRPTRPVTMRPHAVQQWLSTLTACSPDELRFVINGILWELSERGMSIVDMGRVRTVFAPLVDASKRQLEEELAHHRNLIADRYGENAANAFAEIGGVDAPFIAELARRTRAKREDRQDCTLRSRAPGTTATQGNPETKRGKNQTQAPENRSEKAVETH